MSLLQERLSYKPFEYPWAYTAWETQQRAHWLAEEVPLADDVQDWKNNITSNERNLLTQIFRFFTQADVEVHSCYIKHYTKIFKAPEVVMMLTAFANIETIHIAAYSHLLDTVGMPELEYLSFTKYKEMKDKCDYVHQFNTDNLHEVAKTMAVYGAFMEGLQLFASFAILLNFPRFNKMKGMGQIIAFSLKDESLHTENMIQLFHVLVSENNLWTNKLTEDLYSICRTMVHHEDAFIDLAFEFGAIEGLTPIDVKKYIRYIANIRLTQLGLNPIYEENTNPLIWMEAMLSASEYTNFFENRVTEYSKAATQGTWDDVFTD